jgi:hypothetical protein
MAVSKHVSWGLVKQCKTEVRAISTTNNLGLACPLEMARLKSKACMTAAAVLAGIRLCPTRIRGTLQCSCAVAGSGGGGQRETRQRQQRLRRQPQRRQKS